ncbi:Hsp70 family protein [bacterium]|nr:MAG: Hsp70 family protein [bacterium]
MSDLSFGIDLGTSTSIVSVIQNGRPQSIGDPQTKSAIVPSVVALSRRGELLAGQQAIDDGMPDAKIREAKRDMGKEKKFSLAEHSLLPEEVAALVLKKIKANAEQALGVELDRAVITVPAYFDDLPRRATERAARLAGITPLRLISEPVAAAMAYGIDRLDDEGVLACWRSLRPTAIRSLGARISTKLSCGSRWRRQASGFPDPGLALGMPSRKRPKRRKGLYPPKRSPILWCPPSPWSVATSPILRLRSLGRSSSA